ncbi:MAG: uracil-DNA glycosylase family protein [Verrucomicrobiota bacterium JB023]|nr:uracil-DNA glycosylase family protein [Verrucomicrobiota bacterium JB023]
MLLAYLRQLKAQGKTHLAVSDDARQTLRKLYRGELSLRREPDASQPQEEAMNPAQAPADSTPGTAAPLPEATPHAPQPVPTGETAEEKLASLREQAESWPPALELGSLRKRMVFATGNPTADLVLVGEAPGFQEEKQGEPFVGPAGEKLNQILKAMGLSREAVYISNICKFRPAMPGQTTNNRKPRPEEMEACLPFVRAELEIIRPKVVVALGATAAQGLLESTESVGKLRGNWHQFTGIPLRVTYHPSYLLHSDENALGEKRKVWEDMLAVMEKLELPITDKQRGYFQRKK